MEVMDSTENTLGPGVRVGQGQYIFSFDVGPQRSQAIPQGNLRTPMSSKHRGYSSHVYFTSLRNCTQVRNIEN